MRHLSLLDKICLQFDAALKTVTATHAGAERINPADNHDEVELTVIEQRHAAGLMRVNHVGEVCAQALYQGQALTAQLNDVREAMQAAAQEEIDHLSWCEQRLQELHSHTSYLNPLWYSGAFAIGAVAGIIGDRWSLGFVAETEHQVVKHLQNHLTKLAPQDAKSRAILQQMAIDEAQHAQTAMDAGASELPQPIKKLMTAMSKIMTTTAYYI